MANKAETVAVPYLENGKDNGTEDVEIKLHSGYTPGFGPTYYYSFKWRGNRHLSELFVGAPRPWHPNKTQLKKALERLEPAAW